MRATSRRNLKLSLGASNNPPPPASSHVPSRLQKDMGPPPESTKLEGPDGFIEYVGSGKLLDRAAMITGGDSGIGRSIAALYAREGADVSIVYLPSEQPDADETKRLVEAAGRQPRRWKRRLSLRSS